MEWASFGAAIITAVMSFLGVYIANRKQTALVAYRLEELEKKVNKHNNLIERMYKAEGQITALQQEVSDLKSR